uniref:GIY-YIG endonuclease n=1 Tax=Juglanconis sp. TaxID=2041886 RepID=A0A291LJ55_9PEZI|nr:GIY-YIG endonuclease [Juglanconis sp.]
MYSLLNRNDFFDLFENLDCLAFIPVVSYNDAFSNKKLAITDNKGKSGIYRWTHLESKKSYIGSSVNLGLRLRNYFNLSFISHPTRNMMVINKALLKYGYSKFKFEILEYCGPKELAIREQYYMDQLCPEYNVLKTAYSSLGYKHSENTLVKIHSNLEKLNLSKSVKVVVTNLETNVSTEYISLREAAKSLNTNKTTLKEYIFKNIPYKGIYKLESNLSVSNYSNYLNHPASKKIEVVDLELNTVTNYTSIRAAARDLDIGFASIGTYLKRNQKSPYKGRYIFKNVL